MRSEDRRDLATATVGAGGLAAGGVMRHTAVRRLKKEPGMHLVGVLRHGDKRTKRLFAAGSALGLTSIAPLAVGSTRLATGQDMAKSWRDKPLKRGSASLTGSGGIGLSGMYGRSGRLALPIKRGLLPPWEPKPKKMLTETQRRGAVDGGRASSETQREKRTGQHRSLQAMQRFENRQFNLEKRDPDQRGFLGEGLRGSVEALRGRAKGAVQPVPAEVRATQLGIAAGAGFGGGALARSALRGKTKVTRPALAPIAGALAATASLPLTNRAISSRGYTATPYGVKRTKTAATRPSSKSSAERRTPRSFREDLSKAENLAKAAGGVAAHFIYTQAPDDRPNSWAPKFGEYPANAPSRQAGKPFARKGRRVVVPASQLVSDRPGTRRGGVGLHGKIPLRGAKKWARNMQLDGEYAALASGHENPIRNVEGDLLKARRQYLKPRVAAGAAAVGALGAGGYALSRRREVKKAESYLGSRTGYGAQRAAVTAAGHPPVIGPLTAAAAAGKYAPPGQERKHAARQYALGSGIGIPAGIAGAYGGAALGHRSKGFADKAQQSLDLKDKAEGKLRSAVGLGAKTPKGPTAYSSRAKLRLASSKIVKPLIRSKGAVAGATAGFFGVKAVTGAVGGQAAISLNQRDQNRYNVARGISKAVPAGTKVDQHRQARRKKLNADLSTASGAIGVTGLGLLASGRRSAAANAAVIGGGLGGLNGLLYGQVARREAKQADPFAKRESLKLTQDKDTNASLIGRYGSKGSLPKGLERGEKMRAYEARYVHHGGARADKYGRRAEAAEGTRNVGLGVATTAGAGYLATKTRLGRKIGPKLKHRADVTAVAGGTLAGGAELYGEYARGRRASYTNSPAGVAGSALRRMRAYTPD